MPLLTTYLDFANDPISLPNAVPSTGNAEATRIQSFITKYEPIFLKTILGMDLYTLFIAGLDANTAIYEAIRDGGTYDDIYGITQEWEGFVSGNNPIANFIYWYYQKSNASITTGIGETNASVENGTRTSPNQKMVESWNEMVDYNNMLHGYLYANSSIYPTYIGVNSYLPVAIFPYMKSWKDLFTKQNMYGI